MTVIEVVSFFSRWCHFTQNLVIISGQPMAFTHFVNVPFWFIQAISKMINYTAQFCSLRWNRPHEWVTKGSSLRLEAGYSHFSADAQRQETGVQEDAGIMEVSSYVWIANDHTSLVWKSKSQDWATVGPLGHWKKRTKFFRHKLTSQTCTCSVWKWGRAFISMYYHCSRQKAGPEPAVEVNLRPYEEVQCIEPTQNLFY